MKIIIRLVLIVVFLFIAGGCNSSTKVIGGIGTEIGNLAPDFHLQNMEGQNVTLSNLRGNPIIINFWASWCGPCREEMPFLQQIYEKWQNEGVLLLTVNLRETPSVITEYMQSNGLSFPVLLDVDGMPVVERDHAVHGAALHAGGTGVLLASAQAVREVVVSGDVEHGRRGLRVPVAPGLTPVG